MGCDRSDSFMFLVSGVRHLGQSAPVQGWTGAFRLVCTSSGMDWCILGLGASVLVDCGIWVWVHQFRGGLVHLGLGAPAQRWTGAFGFGCPSPGVDWGHLGPGYPRDWGIQAWMHQLRDGLVHVFDHVAFFLQIL